MKIRENERKVAQQTLESIHVIKKMVYHFGITHCEPKVIEQFVLLYEKYISDILQASKCYASHDQRSNVTLDDIKLVLDLQKLNKQDTYVSVEDLKDLSDKVNKKPLPDVKTISGVPFPAQGDYSLTKQNYRYRENVRPEMLELPKHQFFPPINIKYPNFNVKSRIPFHQQPSYSLPLPNSICRINPNFQNNLIPMQKQKFNQNAQIPAQKVPFKAKMPVRNNVDTGSLMNTDQRKEIIKRSVCMEPQKIVFKPKLLLSLNTNADMGNCSRIPSENCSPSKCKKVQ